MEDQANAVNLNIARDPSLRVNCTQGVLGRPKWVFSGGKNRGLPADRLVDV